MSRFLTTILLLCCLSASISSFAAKEKFPWQEVNSFDIAVDNGKVHVLLAAKTTKKDKAVLYYLSSKDSGKHWQKPVLISSDTDPIATRGNDVQIAAAGNKLVSIWQTKGEFPSMGAMISYYSKDGGKTWHKGSNPAVDNNGDQSHLDVIADKQGYFHVAWLSDPEENGYQSLRYARSIDGGVQWQTAQLLDDSTCSCCWNSLAVAPNGAINLLYRDMKPRDMALMQSTNAGETWWRINTVGEFGWHIDGCPHIGGGLAIDKNNKLYATVWTGLDKKAGLYTLSSNDNGKTWTEPKPLGELASHSDIAVNGKKIIAIWDERTPDGSNIYMAKSQDQGNRWTKPKRLSEKDAIATHPRIVATKQGFLAAWTEKIHKKTRWQTKLLN